MTTSIQTITKLKRLWRKVATKRTAKNLGIGTSGAIIGAAILLLFLWFFPPWHTTDYITKYVSSPAQVVTQTVTKTVPVEVIKYVDRIVYVSDNSSDGWFPSGGSSDHTTTVYIPAPYEVRVEVPVPTPYPVPVPQPPVTITIPVVNTPPMAWGNGGGSNGKGPKNFPPHGAR